MSASLPVGEAGRYQLSSRMIIPLFADRDRSFKPGELPDTIGFLKEVQAEHIDYAGWPLAIGPLLDRLAARLGLNIRIDKDTYPEPNPAKAKTQSLSDQELYKVLSYDDYAGWYIDNFGHAEARYLVKTFNFKNFRKASMFMGMVADYCRVLDHHPEWRNVYKQVTVSLSTWDAKRRITIYDLNVALYMNKVAQAVRKTD
jgi:pterin-4a-carbinolamine dehydratase